MNPRSAHALADDRHAARYAGGEAARHAGRDAARCAGPRAPALPAAAVAMRRRLGLLLVEAGLHLITAADRPRRRASLAS